MGSISSPGDPRRCHEPPRGARNSPQVQPARKQGPRYNFEELHSVSNPNGQKPDSPLKLRGFRKERSGWPLDFSHACQTSDLQSCEAICAASDGEFVVLCYENICIYIYINLSLLIFKNFLSELPPNIRPSYNKRSFQSFIQITLWSSISLVSFTFYLVLAGNLILASSFISWNFSTNTYFGSF